MALISLAGIVLVLVPSITTHVANFLGVGRGVDLVLYSFILIMLTAVFNLHIRLRAEHQTLTELARAIAIYSASRPTATR
jgi:hypothetical protein